MADQEYIGVEGLQYPENGLKLFQEDFESEQGAIGKEVIDREADFFSSGIIEGFAVSASATLGCVNVAAGKARDPEGRCIIKAATNAFNVPDGQTVKLIVRHLWIDEPYTPEGGAEQKLRRRHSAEIAYIANGATPGDRELVLARVTRAGSTVTVDTDLREWAELVVKKISAIINGWILDLNTWEYVSADAPTYVFRVNVDATGYLFVGQKIKYTQDATTKYGIITAIGAYSGGYTNITIYGGGNTASPSYAMTANAITIPYYAATWRPFDFPMNPDTWSYIYTSEDEGQKNSPLDGIWYNLDNVNIIIPIGLWETSYQVAISYNPSSSGHTIYKVTLSTSATSESDRELTGYLQTNDDSVADTHGATIFRKKILNLINKTTYYLNNCVSRDSSVIRTVNSVVTLVIKAVCQYL